MKLIQSLQRIINDHLANEQLGAEGLLVTWASTLRAPRRGKHEELLEQMHTTIKTHYACIPPRELEKIVTSQDRVIAPAGVGSLTYLDKKTLYEASRLLEHKDVEVIGIYDKDGLKDDEWLRHLVIDKHISFSEIAESAIATINGTGTRKNVEACLDFTRICKERMKGGRKKRLYMFSSTDESATKLAASIFFSYFPDSLVLAVPISSDDTQALEDGDKMLQLDDSVATTKGRCRRTNSIYYKSKVSAIINLYKRQSTCVEIYNALTMQTYPITHIYVWVNGQVNECERKDLREAMPMARFVFCDENMGVWARFAFGLNMHTEFSVVFDDDTIPGSRWIENCMKCMSCEEALYGTVGLIYNKPLSYMNHRRIGWPAPNIHSIVVDIVGHSWFFKTDWLRQYWHEVDDIDAITFCGEDMHFSYALQAIGIRTIVPPHPIDDMELWGSLKGFEAGTGEEAISISGKGSMMDVPLKRLVERGFKLVSF